MHCPIDGHLVIANLPSLMDYYRHGIPLLLLWPERRHYLYNWVSSAKRGF